MSSSPIGAETTPAVDDLHHRLTALLGADLVQPEVEGVGCAASPRLPEVTVKPRERREVAELLRWASANGVTVSPVGGGVFAGLGNISSEADVALNLTRLDRVLDFQPADLTATVEAGITFNVLRDELRRGDKFVPLESPQPHRSTVGGILATGHSGPMRHSYGLPRDWLIGISVVGADGVETKAGGRVVKNVTGYDLNKLYTGSLGTLGVIVEASFKLAPVPDTWAGITATFRTTAEAVEAGRALVEQVYAPQGIQVVSRAVAERIGLAMAAGHEAAIVAIVNGRPRAVARRIDGAAKLLGDAGATNVDSAPESDTQRLLARLADLPWAETDPPQLAIKVTCPRPTWAT